MTDIDYFQETDPDEDDTKEIVKPAVRSFKVEHSPRFPALTARDLRAVGKGTIRQLADMARYNTEGGYDAMVGLRVIRDYAEEKLLELKKEMEADIWIETKRE